MLLQIKVGLITIGIFCVIGLFVPDKYLPKPKPRKPLFSNWNPDDTGGLRWMGNKKRRRKKNDYRF